MRIWSLHPKYLDAKGLVALWRETLLAKHVLLNKTRGYKNHPQLLRFKNLLNPAAAIDQYLEEVWKEANQRGYHFDAKKISTNFRKIKMKVNKGQLEYETLHLLNKLKRRDPEKYRYVKSEKKIIPHPLFSVVPGGTEDWEII
jgi:hypothetical protein